MSPDDFEPHFAESLVAQWGRGPHLFRNALRRPMFADGEFMAAMLGASKDYAANPGAADPPGRLFLGSEQVKPEDLPPLMPRSSAETRQEFVSRIRQSHPNDQFGVVLDNCEKHVPSMRDRLVPTLHHLFSRVGYPARRNHLCIYAGTYRSTPFGIHRDDCHVLMFCGAGTKAMAFWPRAYFDPKRELLGVAVMRTRVQDHLARATVLEIGPLDVLYWSTEEFHVAVSDTDQFHAALSVGIYHHGSIAGLLASLDFLSAMTRVDPGLDFRGFPAAPTGRLTGEDLRRSPMAAFFERWEQLRDRLNRSGEVEFQGLRRALRLISSAGYGKLRAARTEPVPALEGLELICAVPQSLVVGRARGGLMIGANGSVFFYDQAAPQIEDAVLRLRDAPRRFDDVMGSVESGSVDHLAGILRDLVGAGALSVRTASDGGAAA